ncbi:MAG: response regulator transcription factor [Nitrospiraceae bacterium]
MASSETKIISLFLVDDHEVVRLGLRALIERTGLIQVVGQAGTVAETLEEVRRLQPDVVLMDVRLPDGNGAEACREIRSLSPATRVLFLTSFSDEEAVQAAIFGGASGYLLKNIGGDALLRGIMTVAAGQAVMEPTALQGVQARLQTLIETPPDDKTSLLTAQEQRLLAKVAEGLTNKEIASALGLSDKTVRNYLSHVFKKLQMTRRSQIAAYMAKRDRQ